MRRLFAAMLAVSAMLGCQENPSALLPTDEVAMEEAAVPGDGVLSPGILPAHRLPWEYRVAGKQDASSDYRAAHPQWYAITQPPTGNFRPMKEWEPMQANIITYSDYLSTDADTAKTMADIVVGSLPYVEMWVIYNSEAAKADLVNRVKAQGVTQEEIDARVRWFQFENDAMWVIDYGPLPLVNEDTQTVAFGDFRYYPDRVLDDAIPTRLANAVGTVTYRSPFDYEGGNFQADGEKYCYFSERVYQYTGMSFDDVEGVMQQYYGCKYAKVLKDISNDGTGHIDMFFKLGGKHVAIVGDYTTVTDADNDARMEDNVAILESVTYDDTEEGIAVYRIPMPNAGAAYGEKIPRTFINSTLITAADGASGVNLWPMYTVDKDLEAQAQAVWEQALPNFTHVGVVSDQISLYSGAIHCVTRTIPALPLAKWAPDGTCVDGKCQGEGYDGVCISASEETPGCWGPKWACLCNDCTQGSCAIPTSCGNGTCEASEGCFKCPQDCACASPETCNVISNTCGLDQCGNGTCDEGENCTTCAKDCGCTGSLQCSYGVCVADPCGTMTDVGCCDGSVTVYCDSGNLVALDCGTSSCGWVADKGWYDCGSTAGGDPSGEYPLECKGNYDYPPGCAGKECGDNGGGYSCGECAEGKECSEAGVCQDPCVPVCDGKECGDNGCGGSCGECADGKQCNATGICESTCVAACDGKQCGDDGCGGSCGECTEGTCSEAGQCVVACVPACDGKVCGDDGCGGSCGECAEGTCSDAGQCVAECVPVCDGKQCGDDGCGGTCGECADGTCSEAGVCQVTEPEEGDSDGGCTAALDTRSTGSSQALILAGLMLALLFLRRVRG